MRTEFFGLILQCESFLFHEDIYEMLCCLVMILEDLDIDWHGDVSILKTKPKIPDFVYLSNLDIWINNFVFVQSVITGMFYFSNTV